jgi:serine/threonine-protein kinase RsbT
MLDEHEAELSIDSDGDLVEARKAVRQATMALGFGVTDVTRIVTAVSELARNILRYAGTGKMCWHSIRRNGCPGIELTFADNGPGISDISLAMQEGYSTSRGLGLGLPGTKRLMDEMSIESAVGKGTTVKICKWLGRPGRDGDAAAQSSGRDCG